MRYDRTEDEMATGSATRVGEWTIGFHGALTPTDRREFRGVSVRDVALGRRSLGAGSLDALTELQSTQSERHEPSLLDGDVHVGLNTSDTTSATAGGDGADGYVGAIGFDERPTVADQGTDRERPSVMTTTVATSAPGAGRDFVVTVAPVLFNRRSTDSSPEAVALEAAPRHGEGLEAYIERRLEEASFVFLPNRGRGYAIAKRAVDLVGALILLVVGLPIILVLTIIIRIDSPGPALFRQTRVTRGGRTFRFYKFRTMYVDAKDRFPDLYNYEFTDSQFDDAFYKLADDPRNTCVGRWLRRTTLDELPNLFNVVLGDLSLVGPRPELPDLVRYYKPEELACFFTKAGLTGLAQVAGRSLLTVRERLTLDLRYVAHQTLLLDLRILCRTVLVVIAGRGAF